MRYRFSLLTVILSISILFAACGGDTAVNNSATNKPANANTAVVVNNYDWFKEFNFLQFLREVGKHLTVNYMMAKDSVKRRLGSTDGDEQRASRNLFVAFSDAIALLL